MIETGINSVTLKEIAARANLSPDLLYHNFSDKEGLVIAALAVQEDELQRGLEDRFLSYDSSTEKLIGWMEYLLPGDA
jgi:AcrR family transcriptional regulator